MLKSKFILKTINKLFPLPVHPFNLQNHGKKSYAQWQFEKGFDAIKFYLPYTGIEEMFEDKMVLDLGCGAAGKSIYYAKQGVKFLFATDLIEGYRKQAENLAKENNLQKQFEFIVADAAKLPFKDNFFDTIILNDTMEHVSKPQDVLAECHRTLKNTGKIYINFPPYYHPYGAHLSDAIGIPWVHLFFSDETLIETYKDLIKSLPDRNERLSLRISKDIYGKEYFSYINRMTIKKFDMIIYQSSFKVVSYKLVPLRKIVTHFSQLPLLKEYFTGMVVYIGEKS